MKVKELFEAEKIDKDFISHNFDGKYWESVQDFLYQNWEKDIDRFTPKQGAWLTKILDDCVERRIEG